MAAVTKNRTYGRMLGFWVITQKPLIISWVITQKPLIISEI
jgi:hypothetical protein